MNEVPDQERVVAGRYRLLGALGEGGMGTVWRGRDDVLHREVAVREVRPPAGLPPADAQRLYARLEREAWAAARVTHRGVVAVYDVAADDARPWIVMELVRGLSLRDVLDAEGPLPPRRAAHIGAEVLSALRAAHEAGVLHRDVRPANVLLGNDGRVVLTDFGITPAEAAPTPAGQPDGTAETAEPPVHQPELAGESGPEADLRALGVLLYAVVQDRSPIHPDTTPGASPATAGEPPKAPERAGALAPVIEGLLRKDPALRLSAEDAERDLRLIAAGGAPRARPGPAAAPGEAAGAAGGPSVTPARESSAGPGGPSSATATADSGAAPRRSHRRAFTLAVSVAALVLLLGGLAYALLNRADDGPGRDGGDPGTSPPHTGQQR